MSLFFLVIALVASGFLGIQILMMIFGFDMDFDADVDADAGDLDGFLSIRSLTAFFGGFGWGGLVGMQNGWVAGVSIAFGTAIGGAFFVIAGLLFLQARKLSSSGNVDYATSVGTTGTVYVAIPSGRSGNGKIEINASGRISIVNALSDAENVLPPKTQVRVTEVIDLTTVLVEPA